MAKTLTQYWIIQVETFACEKHGPYFDEKEVDDAAKVLLAKIVKDGPARRIQHLRLVLMEMNNKNFEVSLYTPEFLLDLIK